MITVPLPRSERPKANANDTADTVADKCLRPLRALLLFSVLAFVLAASFVTVVEVRSSLQQAHKDLSVKAAEMAPIIAREKLLADMIGLETVRASLLDSEKLDGLEVVPRGVPINCPTTGEAVRELLWHGSALLCVTVPLTRYLPGERLRVFRRIPFEWRWNNVLIVLSHAASLSLVGGLGYAFVRRSLQIHVIAPVSRIERRISEGVDVFWKPEVAVGRIDPASLSVRELRSIVETLGDASQRLRVSMEERERLAKRHAAAAALGDAARLLAHDLREPSLLTRSFLRLMREAPSEAARTEVLEVLGTDLEASVTFLEDSVQDLLTLGAPRSAPGADSVDVADLLGNALRRTRVALAAPSYPCSFDVAPGLCVQGDERRLARVFGNLLKNSHEAMGPEDVLDLSAAQDEEGRVRIRVANTGPSLDAEQRSHVFEPFVTAGKVGGTGLGLAVVRDIVEAHGGTVACLPHCPSGVCFEVVLPHAPVSGLYLSATTPSPAPKFTNGLTRTQTSLASPHRRLCVVEDNAVFRALWKHVLRANAGADVRLDTFSSPRAFHAALDAGTVSLSAYVMFVLDVHFKPGEGDGRALAAWLDERTSAPIVLCSSDVIATEKAARNTRVALKSEDCIRALASEFASLREPSLEGG